MVILNLHSCTTLFLQCALYNFIHYLMQGEMLNANTASVAHTFKEELFSSLTNIRTIILKLFNYIKTIILSYFIVTKYVHLKVESEIHFQSHTEELHITT